MASTSTSVVPAVASSTPAPTSTSFAPVASDPSFTQSVPPDNGETTVIDDTDPNITYTASGTIPWNVTSDANAYNRTIHQTRCNSCPATLLFNGTGLSLTSIISPAGSNFMVWVDGTSAGPYSLQNAVEQYASVYSIEGLQYLQHNATFMKYSNDPNDSSFFNIDSITIINRPNTGASYVPPTPSGRTSITQTQTGASPSNVAPIASESSPPPIGAIVGGTIGGIALIIVVVAWIIIMRRRKAAASAPAYAEDRYAQDRYTQDRYAQDHKPRDRYSQDQKPRDRYSQDHKPQERYAQERKPQDRYAQDHYPQDEYARGARRSADRRSGEQYRSGYTDPRYAQGYSSSNNGYSRAAPASRVPSSRAASRY